MRSLLAFGLIAAVMWVCGLGDKQTSEPPANAAQAPAKAKPDKTEVLAELVVIEKQIVEASLNGDITLLARFTTDDFELTDVDGKRQNKNQALADVKVEKGFRTLTITEPELMSFTDTTAVMKYVLKVVMRNGRSGRVAITNSYVKKDGGWLLKTEQQQLLK